MEKGSLKGYGEWVVYGRKLPYAILNKNLSLHPHPEKVYAGYCPQ